MMNVEQIEELRSFCRRAMGADGMDPDEDVYTAIGEHDPDDIAGYVVVREGRKFNKGSNAIDRVLLSEDGTIRAGGRVIGDRPDELADFLLHELNELSKEHPRLYVAYYVYASTSTAWTPLRLDFDDTEPDSGAAVVPAIEHDWSDGPNAFMGSVGGMVERTNLLLARQLDGALNRLMTFMEEVSEARGYIARLQAEKEQFERDGQIMLEASKAAAVQAAWERAAPMLEQALPVVAPGVLAWLSGLAAKAHAEAAAAGGTKVPTEPTEATSFYVDRLGSTLNGLYAHVQSNPDALTPEHINQLKQLMMLAGAAVAQFEAQPAADPDASEAA